MFRVKFRGCYFAMGTIVIIFAATFPCEIMKLIGFINLDFIQGEIMKH